MSQRGRLPPAGATHSQSPTSTRLGSSSATARRTPPWRQPGTPWCKRRCRCARESPRPTACSGWNGWSISGYRTGAGAAPGAATRSPPDAPGRWTYPAEPGATARRSTAETGCSWLGTWSPLLVCWARYPSTAPLRRRAAQCRRPASASRSDMADHRQAAERTANGGCALAGSSLVHVLVHGESPSIVTHSSGARHSGRSLLGG